MGGNRWLQPRKLPSTSLFLYSTILQWQKALSYLQPSQILQPDVSFFFFYHHDPAQLLPLMLSCSRKCFHSMLPRPAVSAALGHLIGTQIIRPHRDLHGALEAGGPALRVLTKLSRRFLGMLKLDNHCCRRNMLEFDSPGFKFQFDLVIRCETLGT